MKYFLTLLLAFTVTGISYAAEDNARTQQYLEKRSNSIAYWKKPGNNELRIEKIKELLVAKGLTQEDFLTPDSKSLPIWKKPFQNEKELAKIKEILVARGVLQEELLTHSKRIPGWKMPIYCEKELSKIEELLDVNYVVSK